MEGILITEAAVKVGSQGQTRSPGRPLFEGSYAGTARYRRPDSPLNLKKGAQNENRCSMDIIEPASGPPRYGTKYECADKHTSTEGR